MIFGTRKKSPWGSGAFASISSRGRDGQLLTGTLMDYAIPRADEVPQVQIVKTCTPSPLNPLGAKGVGEAGCIGIPPAVVNAAVDALSPFGVTQLEMPLTPARLWEALRGRA